MADVAIRTVGLKEVVGAFGRIDKSLRRELQQELRPLARLVRDRARREAIDQGFAAPGRSGRGRGELLRRLSYSVRGSVAAITESARTPSGFRYPAVFEFGKKQHRPFLLPAVEVSRGEVLAGLEGMLDRLISKEGLGRGGRL